MPPSEAYLGLARKYRPQTFEDLIGQESVADSLSKALRQNRVVHGHLMAGPRGTGKTTTARILARALNCVEGPTAKPCGKCRHCIDIAAGNDMDVIEVDGASNNGVENIRELRENVNLSPFAARFKVYIIDEVHMLSSGAFNALLKTLEEPPPGVIFIFATTELEKVPETIQSRCTLHQFRRITTDDIIRRLAQVAEAEKVPLAPDAAREIFGHIARSVDGGMRDAMMVFDQLLALTDGRPDAATAVKLLGLADPGALAKTVDWLVEGKADELLGLIDDLAQRGRSLERFVKELVAYLRDLLLLQAGAAENLVELTGEPLDNARRQARELDPAPLYNMINQILELEERLKQSTQTRFLLEFTFLRLARVKPLVPIGEILNRLQALPEQSLAAAPPPRVEAPSQPARRAAEPAFARAAASARAATVGAVLMESSPDYAGAPLSDETPRPDPETNPLAQSLVGLRKDELLDLLERQLPDSSQFLAGDRYLRQAADVLLDGATLRVLWGPQGSFIRRMIDKPENMQRLEAALRQIAGQNIKLVNSDAPAGLAPAPNPQPAASRLQDPLTPRQPRMNDSGDYDSELPPLEEREAPLDFYGAAPAQKVPAPAQTPADSRTAVERAQAFLSVNDEAPRRFKLLRDMFNAQPIDENGQPLAI